MRFTPDVERDMTNEELKALYTSLMGPDEKTEIVFPRMTRKEAEAWLLRQHEAYKAEVGRRSSIIKNMKIVSRVTFLSEKLRPL